MTFLFKILKHPNGSLTAVMLLLAAAALRAQSEEAVLKTTRKVADKIIRETSFDYRQEPLLNNFWSHFQTVVPPEEVTVAKSAINVTEDRKVSLGLAFSGTITVFVNGQNVFSGSSQAVDLLEYTYNRFKPQERVELELKKGSNQLIVICSGGKVNVLMLPLDELGERDNSASFAQLVTEPIASHWLISGPYKGLSEQGLLAIGQSNEGLSYTAKGDAWRIPSYPIARQLVVPSEASFQRHPYSEWHYANGGTMLGMLNVYSVSEDPRYFDFVKQFADHVYQNMEMDRWQFENIPVLRGAQYRLFRLTMLDDSGGPALPFVELKRTYDESSYDDILKNVLNHVVNEQDRLSDNTLCRSEPETNTIWGDDLFMSTPFLCRMAIATGQKELFDDVANQIIQFNQYLMNPETGLYFHGYYADRGEPAPFQWGRANGWVTWAMSEALMLMPKKHKDYRKILKIYRNHLASLVKYQEESGIWHQILNDPSTYEETSCTAMYTLSLARGVNQGWLDESYKENALAGWSAVTSKIGPDGTVSKICRGTGIGESVAFYNSRETFDHDPRGLGAVLTAGSEVYKMLMKE